MGIWLCVDSASQLDNPAMGVLLMSCPHISTCMYWWIRHFTKLHLCSVCELGAAFMTQWCQGEEKRSPWGPPFPCASNLQAFLMMLQCYVCHVEELCTLRKIDSTKIGKVFYDGLQNSALCLAILVAFCKCHWFCISFGMDYCLKSLWVFCFLYWLLSVPGTDPSFVMLF